jgi:hypothetical protein
MLTHRAYRKGLQNLCLNLLRKFGSLRMKVVVDQIFSSVVLQEIMNTNVPQFRYAEFRTTTGYVILL